MLQTAIEAARRAGQIITEHYATVHAITVKGYRDIATEADTLAEAAILGLIRERFPQHTVLSEEAGGSGIGEGITWVVDPLDGTTNYAHRLPGFAVSIGVLEHGDPVLGVVYDPLRDYMFVAERGKGATLNGEAIHVSRIAILGHAVVGLDWGRDDAVRERTLACLGRVARRCGTIRALGSATLMLAYVAAGWLDGYFNLMLKPWDIATGLLLITEAGGRCSTLDGEPYRVGKPECLATNGLLHDALLAVMGPCRTLPDVGQALLCSAT